MNQFVKNLLPYSLLSPLAAFLMVAECSAYVSSENQNIVIDSNGAMIAAWIGTDLFSNHHVTVSISTDGAIWTTPEILTPLTNDDISKPSLILDSLGNCLVVWITRDTISQASLLMSAWLPNGGSWTAPVAISSASETAQGAFTVKINSADQFVVTWQSNDANFNNVIDFAMTTFGSNWTSPRIISDNS